MSIVVTARIKDDLHGRLVVLAKDLDRPRSWLIARAIDRFVCEELDLLSAIKQGEDDIEAGRVFTQEQVEALFEVGRDERHAA